MSQTGTSLLPLKKTKASVFSHLFAHPIAGLRLAYYCAMGMVSGCLVTEEHQFLPEEQVPTRISVPRDAPALGDMVELPGNAKTLLLVIDLHDPNVDDPLYYRVLLEGPSDAAPPGQGPSDAVLYRGCSPAEGEDGDTIRVESELEANHSERRTLTIPIEPTDLGSGCYRVRVAISSAFRLDCEDAVDSLPSYDIPEVSGDIAHASWWVLSYQSEEDELDAIYSQCQNLVRD